MARFNLGCVDVDHGAVIGGRLMLEERKAGGTTRAERYYKFTAPAVDFWAPRSVAGTEIMLLL